MGNNHQSNSFQEKLPIRVLHEVGRMEAGGIQQLIMNLYHHMDREQIQFDFMVYKSDDYFRAEIEALGGHIYALDENMGSCKLLNDFKKEIHKFKILRRGRYAILHIHCGKPRFCHVAFLAKLAGVPVRIYHGHNMKRTMKHWWNRLAVLLSRQLIALSCNYFFACSHAAAQWNLSRRIVQKGSYEIIKNGIDVEAFRFDNDKRKQMRSQLGLNENQFVLGHVGRFVEAKNHTFLLDIFAEIYQKEKTAYLLLIGEGSLKENMQRKAKALGVQDNVIFYGASNKVNELMQAMDVFVFPSLFEGFGIVALEAQAAGLPTVISDAIPLEVKVTELCTTIALKQPASYWADQVVNAKHKKRKADTTALEKAGYSIEASARHLAVFYDK